MKAKILQMGLVGVLIAGNFIAWSTVYLGYKAFFNAGYDFLQFSNCNISNPLATPCFYGALAFLIGFLVLNISMIMDSADSRFFRKMSWFFVACTLFGWGNVAYEIFEMNQNNGTIVACGARTVTSIWQSSCLYGTLAFTLSLILSVWIYKKLSKFASS